VSGHLCIKCSCDTVGRRGDLAKVASWRRLGLGRAEGVSVAGGDPRARRKSSGVGCPCPRLGSGEARSCPLSGPSLDLIAPIRPLQLCADGGYQLRLGVLGVPLIMVPDRRSPDGRRQSLRFWTHGASDPLFVLDNEREEQSRDRLRECAEATVGSLRSTLEVLCRDVPKILQVRISGIHFT
jgi:hypothetical protein